MAPLIQIRTISLPPPSDDDRRAHDQRVRDTLGIADLDMPLSVLKRLPRVVHERAVFPCVVGSRGSGYRLIDIGSARSFSLALDIGTTNLVASLVDNSDQSNVLTRSVENPQIRYGSDIITRLHHAMSSSAPEVYQCLLDGINELINQMCREAKISAHAIHAMSVAGNTVMTHFFLGLDISTIPVDPFVPVVRAPGFFTSSELRLGINPEAIVYAFPNAGSYVGGDITAGILASGMYQSDTTSILIDVGTNAEVVIGNRDWMIVGAGAAGPALEEGICRIGKRARSGIVYDVSISEGGVSCRTFDGAKPEGICGSGMVSLLFELYRSGVIDQSGTLAEGRHVSIIDGEKAFAIACDGQEPLVITQAEIQSFMKSKAAMFTLLLTLTRSVGVSFGDIKQVYVSGALGTGINAGKAAGIGMIPGWPEQIVTPLGNSSLAGALMLLADGGLARTIEDIAEKITYKPMNDDPDFMREYLGAVFIPHTDPGMLNVG